MSLSKTPLQVFITLLMLSTFPSELSARVFTDKTGKKFEASIMSMTDDSVTLMVPGKGKIYKVPVANLSDIDLDYLKALKKNQMKLATSTTPIKPATPIRPKHATNTNSSKNKSTTNNGLRPSKTAAIQAKYRLVDNYLTNWPTTVSISTGVHVNVVSEDDAKKRYIYHSPNYQFICDVRLSKTIVQKFALMFEATREYCRLLPISSMKAHVPGNQFRNKILLFESMQNYVKNGGHPQAAGIFRSDTNAVLVPLRSLGLIKLSGSYNYDHNGSNTVLAHELTHQLTDPEYFSPGARGWFSEGLAEYCSVTHYLSGNYAIRNNKIAIKKYIIGGERGGRGIGNKTNAPNLKNFMLQPYSSFAAGGGYNYRLGTLITYYFFHMEPDRRNITSFLKALKLGKTGENALAALLNGRTFDELEKSIHKAWKASGIEINFQ
jgi:hypothetical protein